MELCQYEIIRLKKTSCFYQIDKLKSRKPNFSTVFVIAPQLKYYFCLAFEVRITKT